MVNLDFLTVLKSVTISRGAFALSVGDAVFISTGSITKNLNWKRTSIQQLFGVQYDNTDDPNLAYLSGVAFCKGVFCTTVSIGAGVPNFDSGFATVIEKTTVAPNCALPPPDPEFGVTFGPVDNAGASFSFPESYLPCGPDGTATVTVQLLEIGPYLVFYSSGTGRAAITKDGNKWKTTLSTGVFSGSALGEAGAACITLSATKDAFYSLSQSSDELSYFHPTSLYPPIPAYTEGPQITTGSETNTVFISNDGASWTRNISSPLLTRLRCQAPS